MTAVVGILNKQAIAIAADSAVTITNESSRKILNSANKVFALSKYHPIGIMIYNSANFMDTPWETIIKIYRNQLDERQFNSVNEYQIDFLNFLKVNNYFSDLDTEIKHFKFFVSHFFNEILKEVQINQENEDELISQLCNKILFYISSLSDESKVLEEFVDFKLNHFDDKIIFIEEVLSEFSDIIKIKKGDVLINIFCKLIFTLVTQKEVFYNYTGLIFSGFGKNEIYPVLLPVNVSFVFNGKLRYFIDENKSIKISNNNTGGISPFAQTDVINTIVTGVDPFLEEIYINNFKKYISNYHDYISKYINVNLPDQPNIFNQYNIEEIVGEFIKMNSDAKYISYIYPLISAVSNLSKEDLAEMAESLIYLTYLKRRITNAEESVGGPVDVAIISKGDGFIWIKRKHYFKPELNQNFFSNYLKKYL